MVSMLPDPLALAHHLTTYMHRLAPPVTQSCVQCVVCVCDSLCLCVESSGLFSESSEEIKKAPTVSVLCCAVCVCECV